MRINEAALITGGALSVLAIAFASAAAVIGAIWIGAAHSAVFLIPLLIGMIVLERLSKTKLAAMKSKAESRTVRRDDRADAVEASIRMVLGATAMTCCVGMTGYLLYQIAQATSWWVVATIALLATPLVAASHLAGQTASEKAEDGP